LEGGGDHQKPHCDLIWLKKKEESIGLEAWRLKPKPTSTLKWIEQREEKMGTQKAKGFVINASSQL